MPILEPTTPHISNQPYHDDPGPPHGIKGDNASRQFQHAQQLGHRCNLVGFVGDLQLRWGEIISLKWEDVQTEGARVAAAKAKGRRARVVPMSGRVHGVLTKARGQDLVISRDAREIHEKLSTWLRKQGVKDAKSVHYLRKCFGSLAVADHGIFLASKLLGHSSISLTASTYAGQVDQLPAVRF